jgi:predicted GIY-YIG superfamily endonuclease
LQNETKGVYIIQNATRNKFYVGQSKNIEKRISCQHFQKGNCMNQAFMDDYNNSDIFNIAIVPCKTRDELDELEKHYINEFDSFGKGYNKTGGNI